MVLAYEEVGAAGCKNPGVLREPWDEPFPLEVGEAEVLHYGLHWQHEQPTGEGGCYTRWCGRCV